MKTLKFNISGQFAHFRKPDVNQYAYFTYAHIHKVALLGIFGAILGLDGYMKQTQTKEDLPEFYTKLEHLKIAIVPTKNYFDKKLEFFNNSVGYASTEAGGNLIVREQWLQKPSWDIFVLDDGSEEFIKLSEMIKNKQSIYNTYLGKNNHFAKIDNVEMFEITEIEKFEKEDDNEESRDKKGIECISLIPKSEVDIIRVKRKQSFFYEEFLPITLKPKYLLYELEELMLSNAIVYNKNLYKVMMSDDKNGVGEEKEKTEKGIYFI